jgi:hypothetical protein
MKCQQKSCTGRIGILLGGAISALARAAILV